jgi:hypothetical protein
MSEIPDKNENFESTYSSSLMDGYNQNYWDYDGISLTGNPYSYASDTISFSSSTNGSTIHSTSNSKNTFEFDLNLNNTNGFWKYNEDRILKEIKEYLGSTYKSHYTSQESKTQTLDLIESIGDAEPFCRSNAIKYLSRFGKKNGKSKMDILKAIHYCILLWHFSGLDNEIKESYETF